MNSVLDDSTTINGLNEPSEIGTGLDASAKHRNRLLRSVTLASFSVLNPVIFPQFTQTPSLTRIEASEPITPVSYSYSGQEELPQPFPDRTVLTAKPVLAVDSEISLQKWEGQVLEVLHDSFTARLTDRSARNGKEDAELSFSEVSSDDMPLLKPGAIFYWTIGRHTDSTNRPRILSELRFRRLPTWTEEEVIQASLEAQRLATAFGIE